MLRVASQVDWLGGGDNPPGAAVQVSKCDVSHEVISGNTDTR